MLFIIRDQTGLTLHENQHGFVNGKSCDSNLSAWTGVIEKGFIEDGFTVGVYIDIKGAFDNATNDGIKNMMNKKGCNNLIIAWFLDFLEHRNITVKYKGYTVQFWPSKGTPQGGVASPWLWNIIADEVHETIQQTEGVESIGYADDTVLFVKSKDPEAAIKAMNDKALPIAKRWAEEFGLEIAPEKTVAVLYTMKQDRKPDKNGKMRGSFDKPSKIKFMDKTIEWSDHHKHLGVILEKKLNYTAHIKDKINKAKGFLIRIKNCMGKIHGLRPRAALTMYKWARSVITHGCIVWHQEADKQSIIERLRTFQSYGLRTLGCLRRSTPTAGLEILTHTKPIHLHVKEQAALTLIRTKGCEKYTEEEMYTSQKTKVGHRFAINQWLKNTLNKTWPNEPDYYKTELDTTCKQYMWNHEYKVDEHSWHKDNKLRGVPQVDSDANLYTDGSWFEDLQLAGAGLVVMVPKTKQSVICGNRVVSGEYPIHKAKWHLKKSTIFQCEIYAIKKAAEWLQSHHVAKNINRAVINVDSLGAIKALKSNLTTSKLVKETVETLQLVANSIEIIFRWVESHVENSVAHKGNDLADEMARKGAHNRDSPRLPDLPKIPLSTLRSKLNKATIALWKDEWKLNLKTKWNHRQTKDWCPEPSASKAKEIMKNDRIMWSRKVSTITGHGAFKYHDKKSDPSIDATCNRCDRGVAQTAKHIVAECDAFSELRRDIFQTLEDLTDLTKITDHQLGRFIAESNYNWFFEEEEPEDPG